MCRTVSIHNVTFVWKSPRSRNYSPWKIQCATLSMTEMAPSHYSCSGAMLIVVHSCTIYSTILYKLHTPMLGMPVLCKYAIAAFFAYFAKVFIPHIYSHKLSLSAAKIFNICCLFRGLIPHIFAAYFVLLRSVYLNKKLSYRRQTALQPV